jgi:GDPmannose 4,6-dehydratase
VPVDFVIGTGVSHTVQELVERAFARVGLNWREYVEVSSDLLRPAEVDLLQADPSKARTCLNWRAGVTFEQLVDLMVDADLHRERAAA